MDKLIRRADLLKYVHDVTLANGAKHRCIDATVIHEIPAADAGVARGGSMSNETTTAKERRDALSLAYQVLTDDRNLKKYSMCGIRDTKTMELFEYGDMLRVLRTMHKEAADLAKEAT